MVELFADHLYPLSKGHHSNFSPRSIRIQWRIEERLLCRTGALGLRLLMILDRILLPLQMKWSVHQMVNWTIYLKASGHLPVNLECFGDNNYTPCLLPTIFLAIQTEPILTKFLFQSSYSSLCNSMCFGSVRRTSRDSNSALQFHRTVCRNGSGVFFWTQDMADIYPRHLSWFGLAWITRSPLRRHILQDHCMSVLQSWFLVCIENCVVCCFHVSKCPGNLISVRPIVRIHSAGRPRNFRAFADFATRVFVENEWINCVFLLMSLNKA